MVDKLATSLMRTIQTQLLGWAETSLRDLPWRQVRDPYRVWVSEVMLQQTRVETVIPYYLRWMKHFPTIQALAQADLGEVLKAWEGLGYYARCRNLHRAARIVVEEHDGKLPGDRDALLALPGIGRYTVGAILSLAFDRDAAVLDGNVRRVLSRLFVIDDDPREKQTREKLWVLAEALLPAGRAGQFNEAFMDLGATVCTPRGPHCALCPLNSVCRAYGLGDPEGYPLRLRREPTPHFNVTAGVIWRNEHLLIAQRPLDGLLGGLWEFPGGKQLPEETLHECLKRELREELDIEVEVGEKLTVVRHAFTHLRITVYAYECQYLSREEPKALGVEDWRWVTLSELDDYALPVVDRKIARVVNERWRQPRLI
jgi:A/G-specific adenine glycosylase